MIESKHVKRPYSKIVLAFTLLAASLLIVPSQAIAHSTLIDSTPQPAEMVTSLPEIKLTFSSPLIKDERAKISLATVREGKDIPIGETIFESDTVIYAKVPDPPKPGQYVIRYVVTAADGDLNDGGYAFEFFEKQDSSRTWSYLGAGFGILLVMFLLLSRGKTKQPRQEK